MAQTNKTSPSLLETLILLAVFIGSNIVLLPFNLILSLLAESKQDTIAVVLLYVMIILLLIAAIFIAASLIVRTTSSIKAYQHRIRALLFGEIAGIVGIVAILSMVACMRDLPAVIKAILLGITVTISILLNHKLRQDIFELSRIINNREKK